MKWNKDQIQKAFLGALLCCGGLYYYSFEMLAPLAKRETSAAAEIARLEPQIKDARGKIARANAIAAGDSHAAEAQKAYEVLKTRIPNGQPVAWLPTRFAEFFKQQGIVKPLFHSNPEPSESEFPGYKITSWTMEFSTVGFAALGAALAGLENQEGLMQVTNVDIDNVASNPEVHHAQLTISTLVKSEK